MQYYFVAPASFVASGAHDEPSASGSLPLNRNGGAAGCVRNSIPGALSISKGAVPDLARGQGHTAPTYSVGFPGSISHGHRGPAPCEIRCSSRPSRQPGFHPAFVYEIELDDPPSMQIEVIDPVVELAKSSGSPLAHNTYHHDGDMDFLLGVVDPIRMKACLESEVRNPPGSGATPRPANLSITLETMVRALRDAEILVIGTIPSTNVTATRFTEGNRKGRSRAHD